MSLQILHFQNTPPLLHRVNDCLCNLTLIKRTLPFLSKLPKHLGQSRHLHDLPDPRRSLPALQKLPRILRTRIPDDMLTFRPKPRTELTDGKPLFSQSHRLPQHLLHTHLPTPKPLDHIDPPRRRTGHGDRVHMVLGDPHHLAAVVVDVSLSGAESQVLPRAGEGERGGRAPGCVDSTDCTRGRVVEETEDVAAYARARGLGYVQGGGDGDGCVLLRTFLSLVEGEGKGRGGGRTAALPPERRILIPAWAARGCVHDTIPLMLWTTERRLGNGMNGGCSFESA